MLPGERWRRPGVSGSCSLLSAAFRIDLMDDSRFELSGPLSFGVPNSASVAEMDRFLDGERNEAGDNEDWRSAGMAMDVSGASRLAFVNESGRA